MDLTALNFFLRIPIALRVLRYEHWRRRPDDPFLSPAVLSRVLRRVQSSLQHLEIVFHAAAMEPEPVEDSWLRTLGDFQCLRNVKVPLALLIGNGTNVPTSLVDLLPAGLHKLLLGVENSPWPVSLLRDLLTELIRAASTRFRNLKSVYLDFDGAIEFSQFEPSWKSAMEQGISFQARYRKGSKVLALSSRRLVSGAVRPFRIRTTNPWMGTDI